MNIETITKGFIDLLEEYYRLDWDVIQNNPEPEPVGASLATKRNAEAICKAVVHFYKDLIPAGMDEDDIGSNIFLAIMQTGAGFADRDVPDKEKARLLDYKISNMRPGGFHLFTDATGLIEME